MTKELTTKLKKYKAIIKTSSGKFEQIPITKEKLDEIVINSNNKKMFSTINGIPYKTSDITIEKMKEEDYVPAERVYYYKEETTRGKLKETKERVYEKKVWKCTYRKKEDGGYMQEKCNPQEIYVKREGKKVEVDPKDCYIPTKQETIREVREKYGNFKKSPLGSLISFDLDKLV